MKTGRWRGKKEDLTPSLLNLSSSGEHCCSVIPTTSSSHFRFENYCGIQLGSWDLREVRRTVPTLKTTLSRPIESKLPKTDVHSEFQRGDPGSSRDSKV